MAKMPLLVSALLTMSMAANAGFETKPDIHGDLVVFTCEGDLWLGNLADRSARRITSDEGVETNARFSPDGKQIAYTAYYDGAKDVYVMDVDGGPPKRLTYDPTGADVLAWTPDGKNVVFRSTRFDFNQRLWTAPVDGGPAKQIPVPRGYFAAYSSKGDLAYVPVSFEWANWYRYKGGGADDIWLYQSQSKAFTQLTKDLGVDTTPVWCGDDIYFVSERNGYSNLWKLNPKTKAAVQVTKISDGPVRYPGADDKRVVFQHGAGLSVFDVSSGKTTDVQFDLNSDKIHERPVVIPVQGAIQNVAPGPSAKRVAVEARGQILSIASTNGDMRVIENKPGARAILPAWSADGQKIAFVSDRSGENEVWTTDASGGGQPSQLTKGLAANPYALNWSPDGKTLALADRNGRVVVIDSTTGKVTPVMTAPGTASYDSYAPSFAFSPDGKFLTYQSIDEAWIMRVYVYDISAGEHYLVFSPNVNSYSPVFDSTGKFVVYLADRSLTPYPTWTHKYTFDKVVRINMVALDKGTPSPFLAKNDEEGGAAKAKADEKPETKLDPDGLADRVIDVPAPAARYRALESGPGRLFVIDSDEMASMSGNPPGILRAFDLDKKTLATLAEGVDGFQKSGDGKKLLVKSGPNVHVVDIAAGPGPLPPAIKFSGYTIKVNPRDEWHQIFNESWRIGRDFFYDPGMHGVDWQAVKAKYEPMLAKVGDRADLSRLLKDMVSELNCGHAYVSGAPVGGRRVPMAFLGIDAEPVAGADAVKIAKILKGDDFDVSARSPLAEPGIDVKEGDYILAIAGEPVKRNQDFQSLLVGKTGQTIAITVNSKPSMEGARIVRVQPLTSESPLRYIDWVNGRIAYVKKYGGENFGYAHISNMTGPGLIGFTKGQFQNVFKEGMIYDTRFNGGGYVSSLLLENIAGKPQAWFQPRAGQTWTREDWTNFGYSAAICNEGNFSDGELFIEVWKRMKLGPVVGKRTGGGEVGSGGGFTLIDGGSVYIPNYAAFADGKWIIEGTGATPDYDVDQDPAAVMAGRDPQLDKAIELLKAKIAKNPIRKPEHPPFPKKGVGA